jgi:hypothetical protein
MVNMAQETQITKIIELGVRQVPSDHRNTLLAIAALAQENARARVAAGSVTDITDNSGGTAAAALAAVTMPSVVTQDGAVEMVPKGPFDTRMGLVEDAHEELGVKASEIIQLIAKGSKSVANISAAASADGTIASITVPFTGTTTINTGVDAVNALEQLALARNVSATICAAVNWVRVAQGLPPITDNSGGVAYLDSATAWGPLPDAAATGPAVIAGERSLDVATTEAALGALRNNIATMAAALTEANAPAIGPFVVATQNAATRFKTGDVTP